MSQNLGGAPIGNDNAKKGKEFLSALRRALARKASATDYRRGLDEIADRLVTAGYASEMWAIKEIADREDGKAKQQTEITGEEGGPVVARIERVIVDKPKN